MVKVDTSESPKYRILLDEIVQRSNFSTERLQLTPKPSTGWNTSIWPILRRFRHPYEFQNDHFYPQMPSLEEKFILKAPFNASATTRKLQQDVENFVLYITEILFQKVFVLLIQIICALFFHLNDILYVCPQTFSSPGPAHLACLPQKSTYPIQTK